MPNYTPEIIPTTASLLLADLGEDNETECNLPPGLDLNDTNLSPTQLIVLKLIIQSI